MRNVLFPGFKNVFKVLKKIVFMKSKFLVLLPVLSAFTISAQVTIAPGAQFSIAGNTQLTLQNTDLVNNGNFIAGNSMVTFAGNASSSISGTQPIQFFEVEASKTNGSSIVLQRAIGVTQRVLFSSGFFNLNGFNTDLGTTGHLDGEQENTRFIGPNGGEVLFNVSLNAPTGSNPANLGVFITSNQDLGNVMVRRGHQSQNSSGGNTVLRYYDILPANNANLNATLRFSYMDGELNGLVENSLVFLQNLNTNWTNLGFTSRDVDANFVEKTGIGSFSRFTLSNINTILPVRYVSFNARCEKDKVIIAWKTGQEQNSNRFNIERSPDGVQWTVIGTVPAAGNSTNESRYSFTDNSPVQNGYYRIAEYDLDGRVQYSSVIRSSCAVTQTFSMWPNPAREKIFVSISTDHESQAMIKIFDSKGSLVKMQKADLLPGNNVISIEMGSVANGVYQLSASWDKGQTQKTKQVLKQ